MALDDDKIPSMMAIPDSAYRPRRQKLFRFNRSLLARKIIVFNLIALGILVAGVLYLSQSDDGRVSQRRADMKQQAEILAAAFALKNDLTESYFVSLATPIAAIVQIYDADATLDMQYLPASLTVDQEDTENAESSSVLTGIMQFVWEGLSRPPNNSTDATGNLTSQFNELVRAAIANPDQTQQTSFTSSGDLYFSVAAPILEEGEATRVVLISSVAGEIDAVIRNEREKILQIFVLAIFCSIILSMVLANSIARPLRRLADAADTAHESAGGRLNPAHIQIPDLTARPDEVGDLSRAMRQMIEALFERIDENKNFAADVSHEIKNPLTSLRSAVETLEYPLEEQQRKELLAVIRDDVGRLDRLVTDIANASRLEGELVRDVWLPVDIKKMLQSHVDFHSGERPDLQITLESGDGDYFIQGLEGRLGQVFVNLISNAMGFVPKDGWIKVSLSHDGDGWIVIRVSDNGPGIPAENPDKVFERFYSERSEAEFGEHSGLGLAISKQIIEAHSGQITVKNISPVGGAEFTIRLPI